MLISDFKTSLKNYTNPGYGIGIKINKQMKGIERPKTDKIHTHTTDY